MIYPEWFFNFLTLGSLIALLGVYAFQVWVFAADARAARAEKHAHQSPTEGTCDD